MRTGSSSYSPLKVQNGTKTATSLGRTKFATVSLTTSAIACLWRRGGRIGLCCRADSRRSLCSLYDVHVFVYAADDFHNGALGQAGLNGPLANVALLDGVDELAVCISGDR